MIFRGWSKFLSRSCFFTFVRKGMRLRRRSKYIFIAVKHFIISFYYIWLIIAWILMSTNINFKATWSMLAV